MKKIALFIIAVLSLAIVNAQTADEIIKSYFKKIGGLEKFKSIKGVKMIGTSNLQGMNLAISIVQLKGGKHYTKVTFLGKEIMQGVSDGKVLWGYNPKTTLSEKNSAEDVANAMLEIQDFPDPFINYRKKGYSIEYLGIENKNGVETHKIKLTKKPITINGTPRKNISYYYFDTKSYFPVALQSIVKIGDLKGNMSEGKMSNYQKVDGIYFPFTVAQGTMGSPWQTIHFSKIEIDPKINDSEFKFR